MVTWKTLQRACKRKGIEILPHGSERLLLMPQPGGQKVCHVLSHNCCHSQSAIVWAEHLATIKRKFGVTDDDFKK